MKVVPFLKTLGLLAVSTALHSQAADLYVAPNGTAAGPGTISQPYRLSTALSGQVGRAGDTFWLRGGTYSLGHIDTTIRGAAGAYTTFRQMPGERARVDGSITLWNSPGYVTFWGFELFSSDTRRISSESGGDLTPADLVVHAGFMVYVPNIKIINMIIHNHTRHGIYMAQSATEVLAYGNVVYNNGWRSQDNADGHNFYIQNTGATKVLKDNLAFNTTGLNYQIYASASGENLVNVTMDGNVAFNAGILNSRVRPMRDFLMGADYGRADNMTFINNMGYYVSGSPSISAVQIGRSGSNGRAVVRDNYLPMGGLLMNNWQTATVTGNTIAMRNNDYVVNLQQTQSPVGFNWNNNTYLRPSTGSDFRRNSQTLSFANWKSTTGYDSQSTHQVGSLTGTKVFVRPNQYEPGRANIVVYNWNSLSTVNVDVSAAMTPGTRYEVRNAQDYFAPPVLTGTYNGSPLPLPMTGLTVERANGNLSTPPPTGPLFNIFVLLPLGSGPTQNTAPTISSIANRTTTAGTPTAAIPFTVGDVETAAGSLSVTGTSSNPTLVPNANLTFGGSGANRTVTLTPAPSQSGTATITVRVSDGQATNSTSFVLTVTSVSNPPTISPIAAQTTREDTSTAAIAFSIGDVETAAGSLSVTGASSNPTLVPNANLTFGGSGANRTVTITPAPNQFGTTTNTITVTDGSGLTAKATFLLTVNAVNDQPTLNALANQAIRRNAGQQTLALNGISSGANNESQALTITAVSGNTSLIPHPTVVYLTPASTGSLLYTPVNNATGTVTMTVTVQDNGGTLNGGQNSLTRTFTVTVTRRTPPPLRITSNRTNVILSWPVETDNYVLQSRSGLSPTNSWTDLTTNPALVGLEYVVTNTAPSGLRFYRLRGL